MVCAAVAIARIPTVGASADASAEAPAAAEAALDALDALDSWLGADDNANRWRTYLHADELRSELAKGDEADPAILARLLQRFDEGAAGLELSPFVAARDALAARIAELKTRYVSDLAKLAWASRGDHTPISAQQFGALRSDLKSKVQVLDAALAKSPSIVDGWTTYLQLDKLQAHLADDYEETAASLAELDTVLQRFRNNQPGLELPVFTDVAKAIVKYRALATWAATARVRDSRPVYERYLSDLQKLLERHHERPTIETGRQLARGAGVIDSLGQSPEFISALRKSYAQPNIFGSVSANFVLRAPNRPTDGVRPVRDCILGTSIFGTAHTLGNVQYDLVESDDSVDLAIFYSGEAHSRTRGIHKPVQVNSTGVTTYSAVKLISMAEDDFTSGEVFDSQAETHNTIHSIRKMGGPIGRKLIEKIAWKRAMQQKGQAERISSEHTRQRVVREFDEIVIRDLGKARVNYESKIRNPLIRRGVSPDYLRMSSGEAGVGIETLFASRNQLGAPAAPPVMMAGHDLSVQLHESAANNYLPLALSSARIGQQTADNPPDIQGNVPNWLKLMSVARPNLAAAASAGAEMVEEAQERIEDAVGAEPNVTPPPFKPYSITLNAEAPASVHFDDNRITIRVRAALLQSEDSQYRNWDFVIVYEIRQEGDRILLTRVGEIEAFPTGFDTEWPRQLTAEETGFRSVLKKNMNARANAGQSFPKQIPIEPVRLSRFGVLVLRELTADDGWLTVGWGLP